MAPNIDPAAATEEIPNHVSVGRINAGLTIGLDLRSAVSLKSNLNIAFTGMYPLGQGFVLLPDELAEFSSLSESESAFLKRFFIARDLGQHSRNAQIIDFTGVPMAKAEAAAPRLFQHVMTHVKPAHDQDSVAGHRRDWWLFARTRPELRAAIAGLRRFIMVPRTSRHFVFQFHDCSSIPDSSVVALATDDAFHLGVLSSRVHICWAVNVGGRLGVGNDTRYQHLATFDPFPFPCVDEQRLGTIRKITEKLDEFRKRQQELHPDLTTTSVYNVLKKLRIQETLTPKDKVIHHNGLVTLLQQIHDELDAAVFDAYGWPNDLTDEEILERLVALNHERAEEEKRGLIRWLRPEFQNPSGGTSAVQTELELEGDSDDEDDAEEQPTKGKGKKKKPAAAKTKAPAKAA